MRKILPLLLIFFIIISVTVSCENSSENQPVSDTDSTNDVESKTAYAQSDMWRVELLNAEIADSLTATLAAVQYDGDILETQNEVKPSSGNIFLLLNLSVEKIGTGKASFSWSDAHILDKDGNVYYRHPNDTFLANINIPRLKGTDIVLGKESGYVCFEIPKTASDLQFVADSGNIIIEVQ